MSSQAESAPFTVADAFRIAREGHAGQTDKSGKPYIGHIWRVMCRVEGDAEKTVAALHDYLEDVRAATPQGLRDLGVPTEVVDAVMGLTKRDDEKGSDEGYFRFVRRAAQNPLARTVKRADLADNTEAERVRVYAEKSRALADELRKVAEQFEQKAAEVEAKPATLRTKYEAAIKILDGIA